MANIISVPKPSPSAYNPNRPLEKNLLIKAQVEHFKEAEMQLPKRLQSKIDPSSVTTEGEASKYIRKVTQALHKSGGKHLGKVKKAR